MADISGVSSPLGGPGRLVWDPGVLWVCSSSAFPPLSILGGSSSSPCSGRAGKLVPVAPLVPVARPRGRGEEAVAFLAWRRPCGQWEQQPLGSSRAASAPSWLDSGHVPGRLVAALPACVAGRQWSGCVCVLSRLRPRLPSSLAPALAPWPFVAEPAAWRGGCCCYGSLSCSSPALRGGERSSCPAFSPTTTMFVREFAWSGEGNVAQHTLALPDGWRGQPRPGRRRQ